MFYQKWPIEWRLSDHRPILSHFAPSSLLSSAFALPSAASPTVASPPSAASVSAPVSVSASASASLSPSPSPSPVWPLVRPASHATSSPAPQLEGVDDTVPACAYVTVAARSDGTVKPPRSQSLSIDFLFFLCCCVCLCAAHLRQLSRASAAATSSSLVPATVMACPACGIILSCPPPYFLPDVHVPDAHVTTAPPAVSTANVPGGGLLPSRAKL